MTLHLTALRDVWQSSFVGLGGIGIGLRALGFHIARLTTHGTKQSRSITTTLAKSPLPANLLGSTAGSWSAQIVGTLENSILLQLDRRASSASSEMVCDGRNGRNRVCGYARVPRDSPAADVPNRKRSRSNQAPKGKTLADVIARLNDLRYGCGTVSSTKSTMQHKWVHHRHAAGSNSWRETRRWG